MISPSSDRRLLVREARPCDLEDVLAVTQEAYAEQRGLIGQDARVFRETVDDLRGRLAAGWIFLLAELSGRPVGALRLIQDEGELYIGRLAVVPGARRAGIGRALMAAAEAWGSAWGLPSVRLGAREDIARNRSYYEMLGYKVAQRLELRNAPGRYFYVMRKALAPPATGPGPTATTSETYERYAPHYAGRPPLARSDLFLERFQEVVPPPALVADVGCGPGTDLQRLRARGYRLCGTDRSLAMLRFAASAGMSLARADLRALPFRDGALDAVWASASLLHLPRLELACAMHELRRVVRRGGGMLATLKMGGGEEWRPTPGGQRFFAYCQPDEVARLAAGAGFDLAYQWVEEPPPGGDHPWILTIARAT